MTQPGQIGTMTDLRAAIDALDADLVRLLAQRAQLIERAIELKPAEGIPARASDRVADVLAKVKDRARAEGLSPVLAERLWSDMIEFFIAREEEVLGKGMHDGNSD